MKKLTYIQALNEAYREEMARDERVFILGEDVGRRGGAFSITRNLLEEFGEDRVRDTPISEGAIVGCAVGAAMTGMRPVAELMYIDFAFSGMDELINQMAKMTYMSDGAVSVPMTVFTQGGMGRGNAAQHSQSLEAMFYHIPGIKIVMPYTPADAKGLLKSAIRDNNPVMVITHKQLFNTKGDVPEEEHLIPIGQARVLQSGEKASLVSYSYMMGPTLEAAEMLKKEGIDCDVIDLMTISPIDYETLIESLKKTNRMVLVSEAHAQGNVISDIAFQLTQRAFDYLDSPIQCVAGANTPVPYCKKIEAMARPSAEDIVKAVKSVL